MKWTKSLAVFNQAMSLPRGGVIEMVCVKIMFDMNAVAPPRGGRGLKYKKAVVDLR